MLNSPFCSIIDDKLRDEAQRQSRKRQRYDEELVVGENLAEGEVASSTILEEGRSVDAAKKPSAA